jgi:hypothetical protein
MKFSYKKTEYLYILFLFLLSHGSLIADSNSSKFRHPLQIQAVGLYSKIQLQGNAGDKRKDDEYSRNQNAMAEGEWKAFDTLSFLLTTGYTNYQQSSPGSFRGRDRIGLGVKSAWESENWLFGGGLIVYNQNAAHPKSENYNPDFYIMKSYLGLGFKIGDFQLQSEVQFQSETNSQFKEKYNDEFRRHYQAGVSISYGILKNLAAFVELETRVPYNKIIDKDARYAAIYPGVSFPTEEYGTFAISGGIPVIDDRIYDRSIRLNYFFIF